MSSFRPDTEASTKSFVAMPFMGNPPASLAEESAVMPSVDFEAVHGVETEAPTSASVSESPTVYSEEEVQARENAAFERGAAAAQVEVDRTTAALVALSKAGASYAEAARSAVIANREGVVSLAAEIARRWVGLELSISGERFIASLEAALDGVEGEGGGSIRLNPDDLARIESEASGDIARLTESTGLTLKGDASLAATEFEVDLGTCSIEGRTDGILERLRATLATVVSSGGFGDAGDAEENA